MPAARAAASAGGRLSKVFVGQTQGVSLGEHTIEDVVQHLRLLHLGLEGQLLGLPTVLRGDLAALQLLTGDLPIPPHRREKALNSLNRLNPTPHPTLRLDHTCECEAKSAASPPLRRPAAHDGR